MALFKCKMCGGDLNITADEKIIECEFCGTTQTIPTSKDENLQGLFNRANILRMKSEFDKAEQLYEKIIEKDETQAEAYWGLILCKYGIEYVEDPTTFKRVPTCHRTSYDSIIADEDYKSALAHADSVQRGIYEAEAKEIDRIQKGILELSQKEEPYDVFICYKETDNDGKRTQDSVIANDIYYQLTQEGLKVFYAAITLENKLGSAYEPCIFAALNSAKVMLAIGTKPEHFNSVWVKNEWSRFLKIIQKDRSKLLIPCYRDMDAYELPEEFAHLQAQDMSKIGFINDIVRGIKKVVTPEEPKQTVVKETVTVGANSNTAPLLERVFMFLEDGDWNSANEYCEKVLDIEPKCAEAYLGKLMAELHVKKQNALKNIEKPFNDNNNYQKAIRFGSEKLKNELEGYISYIKERNEEARKDEIYYDAKAAMNENTIDGCNKAIRLFKTILSHKDSDSLLAECEKELPEMAMEKTYIEAKDIMEWEGIDNYEKAIELFDKIINYKDSKQLKENCLKKIEECKAEIERQLKEKKEKEEQARLEREKQAEEEKARKEQERIEKEKQEQAEREEKARIAKKNKKFAIIGTVVAVVIIAFVIILNAIIIPNATYNKGLELMENGDFDEAITTFKTIENYKDSIEQIQTCNVKLVEQQNKEVGELIKVGKYKESLLLLRKLADDKEDIKLLERFKISYDKESVHYEKVDKTIYYTYDENNNCIKEEINHSNEGKSTYWFYYDKNGNCIKKEQSLNNKEAKDVYEYFYDENGNCIKEIYTDAVVDNYDNVTEYTYDENRKLISDKDKNGSTQYYYDDNGNCIEESYSNGNKRQYKYDEYGNMIENVFVNSEGGKETIEMSYSNCGDLTSEIYTYLSGNVSTHEYKYDEYGNLTYEKVEFKDSGTVNEITHTYEGVRVSFK